MNGHTSSAQAASGGKKSILSLPLAKSLPEFLTPDPLVPSVKALQAVHTYDSEDLPEGAEDPKSPNYIPKPSNLRRSRQVAHSHFSYVTPLPVSFPYAVQPGHVKPRKVSGEAVGDGSSVKEGAAKEAAKKAQSSTPPASLNVEDFLASLEPDPDDGISAVDGGNGAVAFSSENRREALGTPLLAGLSRKCIDEILPGLDVGDAWTYLKEGKDAPGSNKAHQAHGGAEAVIGNASTTSAEARKRAELTQFLAGHIVRMESPQDGSKGFAPWSLCYGGHQFGSWAGQLGDGRAISIMTTPAQFPDYHGDTYYPPVAELQLKGAGRTPYSRFADGLAVLRSSVREYLGSEAIAALGIPTSRALSLVHLPDVTVRREELETAAIVCRVAPSWIRIGSFELLWSRDHWDALRDLVNYAGNEVFGINKGGKHKDSHDKSLGALVLREVARRNAKTFAQWQAFGFCHGVLNTDNISISGLTIDYGPYAFMDVYSSNLICNHSDGEGRYSYRNQPPIGHEAVHRLGTALAELIGCELELAGTGEKIAEAPRGWADDASKLDAWKETGDKVVQEIASEFMGTYIQTYRDLMAKKLGLFEARQSDFAELVDPMLVLMENHHLDFSRTFRAMSQFTSVSSSDFDGFLDKFAPKTQVPKYLQDKYRDDWKEWFEKYEKRLLESEKQAGAQIEDRRARIASANPRFILRQWILEEAISRLRKDNDIAFLQTVLDMATKPFEDYGEEVVGEDDAITCPTPEVLEQRRLCSIGPTDMIGFQCSCSS